MYLFLFGRELVPYPTLRTYTAVEIRCTVVVVVVILNAEAGRFTS